MTFGRHTHFHQHIHRAIDRRGADGAIDQTNAVMEIFNRDVFIGGDKSLNDGLTLVGPTHGTAASLFTYPAHDVVARLHAGEPYDRTDQNKPARRRCVPSADIIHAVHGLPLGGSLS